MGKNFAERLRAASETARSLVCVGLDVDPDKIPECLFEGDRKDPIQRADACVRFNKEIIDVTHDLVCAYKPNLAFYEAEGIHGMSALLDTIDYIRRVAPNVIVIGDSKMGDIGHTAEKYAKAMFKVFGFDAVTINAWGGRETAEPWIANPEPWCVHLVPGFQQRICRLSRLACDQHKRIRRSVVSPHGAPIKRVVRIRQLRLGNGSDRSWTDEASSRCLSRHAIFDPGSR